MARRLRIELPGAIYHVVSRGNRDEPIFFNDEDRRNFLITLGQACAKTGWKVHSYCLLLERFHLALETPRPNLVAGMKWFLGTYTQRFNQRHGQTGHLFAGRYRSVPVCERGDYLRDLCDHIHLLPARTYGILDREQLLQEYAWSSYPQYLNDGSAHPVWLRTRRLMDDCGGMEDSESGRHMFAARVEQLRSEANAGSLEVVERGWYLGDDAFRSMLLEKIHKQAGSSHFGPEIFQGNEDSALRLLRQVMETEGVSQSDLRKLPKGHEAKIKMAKLIRGKTTMTLQWIADHLYMGTATYLAHLLYWDKREPRKSSNRERVKKSTRARKPVVKLPKAARETVLERVEDGLSAPVGGAGEETAFQLTESLDPRFD